MVKILLKWSKTLQTRDQVKVISLPRLGKSPLCPYSALNTLFHWYKPSKNDPLFQFQYTSRWKVLIDSKIRKTLSLINQKLDLSPNFFTFHAFRCSGASLAFNASVLIQRLRSRAPGRRIVCGGTFMMIPLVCLQLLPLSKKCLQVYKMLYC